MTNRYHVLRDMIVTPVLDPIVIAHQLKYSARPKGQAQLTFRNQGNGLHTSTPQPIINNFNYNLMQYTYMYNDTFISRVASVYLRINTNIHTNYVTKARDVGQ
jgi:hypothetical protein